MGKLFIAQETHLQISCTCSFLVLMLLLAPSLVCSANEYSVAPGGLQSAIAGAKPGDALHLLPGIYQGPVTIDKPIKLIGGKNSILEGNGEGMVLTLTADNISISGITVRRSGDDLSKDDAVVLLRDAKSITVENCRIHSRAFGIYLRGGGGHHIVHNEIHGDASLPSPSRGNGIHLWHSEKNEIRENTLSDVRDAIYLSFAHENIIAANRADHVRYGIHYMYSERNTLRDNFFANCTGGIALMFSMGNHIEGNRLINNRDFGILCLQLEHSIVTGNLIQSNGRGLYLEHSVGNRFEKNRLLTNGVGAFVTAGSEQNRFTENSFEENLVQVFQSHANDNTWFDQDRGNAWSDYSGFDWNHDGVGETPYKLQTAASALMARRPVTRWFWKSPVFALLDWWNGFVISPKDSSFDPAPLVKGTGQ